MKRKQRIYTADERAELSELHGRWIEALEDRLRVEVQLLDAKMQVLGNLSDRLGRLEAEIRDLQAFCGVVAPSFEKQLKEQLGVSTHDRVPVGPILRRIPFLKLWDAFNARLSHNQVVKRLGISRNSSQRLRRLLSRGPKV